MAENNAIDSSPDTDRDFDPTAEMLINDFDDERTLEEEEELEKADGNQNRREELDELQKESDMPLEELLALYGYNEDGGPPPGPSSICDGTQSSSSEEILSNHDLTLDKDEIARDLLPGDPQDDDQEMLVMELMDTVDPSVSTSRLLRSATCASDSGSESADDDYVPAEDDDWKKTIQVGYDYQAQVPDGLCKYDGAPAYENDDKLVWDSGNLDDPNIEEYLRTYHLPSSPTATSGMLPILSGVPTGCHTRDDEQALYLLLQCGHNCDEALRRRRVQGCTASGQPGTMSPWSEEECRSFESGLRLYGKDFHLIHMHKVRTRSVGELVQFYYLWKKTERHDIFANKTRLEKKKYNLHPGTTDFMDRFLDEQENPTGGSGPPSAGNSHRASSPSVSGTASLSVYSMISADHKRQQRILSAVNNHCNSVGQVDSPNNAECPLLLEVTEEAFNHFDHRSENGSDDHLTTPKSVGEEHPEKVMETYILTTTASENSSNFTLNFRRSPFAATEGAGTLALRGFVGSRDRADGISAGASAVQ